MCAGICYHWGTLANATGVEIADESSGRNRSLSWPGKEIPSLYGIRGVAALAVVLSHIGVSASNGPYAVICFFVLSGFLITHLLLSERDKTGDVSLRRFYLRRTLRILPAFYCYAAVYVILRLIDKYPVDWLFVLGRVTYTANFTPLLPLFSGPRIPTMGHTWSLAIEEQFYLLWPFIFAAFALKRGKLMKGLIVAIVAVWTYRWVVLSLNLNDNYILYAFETRADALAVGCLVAIANHENRIPRWLIDWKWVGGVALAIICFCSAINLNQPRYAWAIIPLACAVLIIQSIAHSQSRWYSWLEFRPMRALGIISYSLYLYHPFVIHLPPAIRTVPVEVAFAILLATGSYVIVERPFLALKDRFSPVPVRPRTSPQSGCLTEHVAADGPVPPVPVPNT